MRIVVMGSGGLGGYFGGLLARSGVDVRFEARGGHLQALQARGLTVRSVNGDFTVPVQASADLRGFPPARCVVHFSWPRRRQQPLFIDLVMARRAEERVVGIVFEEAADEVGHAGN